MTTVSDSIRKFFDDLATDPMEERVIEYVIREVHEGRTLSEVMNDPYVRNRLNDSKRAEVLENPEIIEAIESEIKASFTRHEVDFSN